MGLIEHPIEFEVCERSGQLPWECGLSACENGCATKTVGFVPASQLRGAVEAERERIAELIRRKGVAKGGDDALRVLADHIRSGRQ